MEKTGVPFDVSSDVLHIPSQAKPTQEEIAKAVAHHNRHHQHDRAAEPGKGMTKSAPGKKQK